MEGRRGKKRVKKEKKTQNQNAPRPPTFVIKPEHLFTTLGFSSKSSLLIEKISRWSKYHFWEDPSSSPQQPAIKWALTCRKMNQIVPCILPRETRRHTESQGSCIKQSSSPQLFSHLKLARCSVHWNSPWRSNQYIKQKGTQKFSNWPNLTCS